MTRQSDVEVRHHGSIYLVVPHTQAARDWVDDHIPEDAQWWGGGFAVEPRYLDDILVGMDDAGLRVAA